MRHTFKYLIELKSDPTLYKELAKHNLRGRVEEIMKEYAYDCILEVAGSEGVMRFNQISKTK